MADQTVVPPPPRIDFDPNDVASMAGAVRSLLGWVNDFYRSTVIESGLLDPDYQSTAGTFDPDSLPDPADSSIARAQQTANEAYKLAQEAKQLAEA
jgi:hypothetical protein